MHRIKRVNLVASALMAFGMFLMIAGGSVPHEPTMAVGLFVSLLAGALLLGVNWPAPRVVIRSSRLKLIPVRRDFARP